MNKVINFLLQNKIQSVLDIGANLGEWSSHVKQNIPSIKLHSIEANPTCEEFLKNRNLNYSIACLSDSIKTIKFFIDPNNKVSTGCSYYLENTNFFIDEMYIELQTKTLDSLIADSYEYIKLDTQGSELDIIKGGMNLISRAKYLQLETSLIEYNKNSPSKEKVFMFLEKINFKPLELVETHHMNGKIIQEDFVFKNTIFN
jgi:FkbM family methyltransferase